MVWNLLLVDISRSLRHKLLLVVTRLHHILLVLLLVIVLHHDLLLLNLGKHGSSLIGLVVLRRRCLLPVHVLLAKHVHFSILGQRFRHSRLVDLAHGLVRVALLSSALR